MNINVENLLRSTQTSAIPFALLTNIDKYRKTHQIARPAAPTLQEYVAWVRTWKQFHQEIVDSIQAIRREKNQTVFKMRLNGASEDPIRQINALWEQKKFLGRLANKLYQARIDNKAALHQGYYVDTSVKVA